MDTILYNLLREICENVFPEIVSTDCDYPRIVWKIEKTTVFNTLQNRAKYNSTEITLTIFGTTFESVTDLATQIEALHTRIDHTIGLMFFRIVEPGTTNAEASLEGSESPVFSRIMQIILNWS
jgi:hypothetical protein